uniref:Pre-rRNA-processing protein TSR2 homolog n=1 Tax=Acrobeloides nanus TaxID=290746 RepID=A0A914D0T5_9BILA
MEVDANSNNLLEKFSEVVWRILKSWTAYQLALKVQMGGSETNEKNRWFHEVLTDFLYSNSNLEIFEIADWIDELIFNDFNLILEDNSSDEISQNLVQCSKWLRANETEKIAEFLSKLPPDDRILSAAAQSSKEARGEESDSSDSESEDESMEEQPTEDSSREKQPKTVTDEEGWTTILPKKK